MSVAALAVPVAATTAEKVSKALTGDIVRFQGQVFRRVKVPNVHRKKGQPKTIEALIPVDVDLHVNPLAIGLGALGLAAAALVGVVAWNGAFGIKGLKETREDRGGEPDFFETLAEFRKAIGIPF